MAPPPTAALALLGIWVFVIFWATDTTLTDQSRVDDRFELSVPDEQSDRSTDGDSSERTFAASDD